MHQTRTIFWQSNVSHILANSFAFQFGNNVLDCATILVMHFMHWSIRALTHTCTQAFGRQIDFASSNAKQRLCLNEPTENAIARYSISVWCNLSIVFYVIFWMCLLLGSPFWQQHHFDALCLMHCVWAWAWNATLIKLQSSNVKTRAVIRLDNAFKVL